MTQNLQETLWQRRSFLKTLPLLPSLACVRPSHDLRGVRAIDWASLEGDRHLGIAVLDTEAGTILGHRLDERFAMCSTFKLLLAAKILQMADQNQLSLAEEISFSAADLVHHAPVVEANLAQGKLTVEGLAKAAQTTSDNVASNLLLAKIGGPAKFTEFCRTLGDEVTRLDRIEPEMNQTISGDERDTTTPRAMVLTLQKVLLETVLRERSRQKLIDWMVQTQTGKKRLRAGFPKSWHSGDKTGTMNGPGFTSKINDLAVTWPPRRAPLIVAAFLDTQKESKETKPEDEAVLARAGAAIAEWLVDSRVA